MHLSIHSLRVREHRLNSVAWPEDHPGNALDWAGDLSVHMNIRGWISWRWAIWGCFDEGREPFAGLINWEVCFLSATSESTKCTDALPI